jgi:hypothetical protein
MAIYTTGGPIDTGFRIARREEESVWKLLVDGDLYVPLCCARQLGKTTLMYQLRERLQKEGFGAVYLYLGGRNDQSAARFYKSICEGILVQVATCLDKDTAPPNIASVDDQLAFSDFIEWLAGKTGRCGRIVIMLDEVGSVPDLVASSFWGGMRSFFTRRGLFRRIMFVLAGELDMYVLATGNNSPLANVCVTPFIELDDLTISEVATLVSVGLPSSVPLADAVHRWTSGHPYLSQKLCMLIQADMAVNASIWSMENGGGSVSDVTERVEALVTKAFPQDVDANIIHIENVLNRTPEYRKRLQRVMREGSIGFTPTTRALAVIGILKLHPDRRYRIRNPIYQRMLQNYFEDYVDS